MGKDFSQSTSTLPVSVTPQMLPTHIRLIATVISRTSGRSGNFTQSNGFPGIGKHWKETCFRFVFGLQMVVYKRKITVGKILKMFSKFCLT